MHTISSVSPYIKIFDQNLVIYPVILLSSHHLLRTIQLNSAQELLLWTGIFSDFIIDLKPMSHTFPGVGLGNHD